MLRSGVTKIIVRLKVTQLIRSFFSGSEGKFGASKEIINMDTYVWVIMNTKNGSWFGDWPTAREAVEALVDLPKEAQKGKKVIQIKQQQWMKDD